MSDWFSYAVGAAIFYGLHQVFTKLAAARISDGLGGFLVEATAALAIAIYLIFLKTSGRWSQTGTALGYVYSILTGVCVGVGTLFFFWAFQKGAPLSSVPTILAAGAALMAVIGIIFFHESTHWVRLLGIALSICGLLLIRNTP